MGSEGIEMKSGREQAKRCQNGASWYAELGNSDSPNIMRGMARKLAERFPNSPDLEPASRLRRSLKKRKPEPYNRGRWELFVPAAELLMLRCALDGNPKGESSVVHRVAPVGRLSGRGYFHQKIDLDTWDISTVRFHKIVG